MYLSNSAYSVLFQQPEPTKIMVSLASLDPPPLNPCPSSEGTLLYSNASTAAVTCRIKSKPDIQGCLVAVPNSHSPVGPTPPLLTPLFPSKLNSSLLDTLPSTLPRAPTIYDCAFSHSSQHSTNTC